MDEKSISYSIDNGDSWLVNVVRFVDQSDSAFKRFEFDSFPKDPSAYDSLGLSKKLRILNLLCDESLQTEKLRNWMDSENQKYIDSKKETNKIKSEAKKKGNDLKKKLKDDMAKAMQSVNVGVPLLVSEQSNLISQIKEESERVHTEMLQTVGKLPKNKQRRDAMRTDPVLCEEEGRVYWELEGYCSNSNIFLQGYSLSGNIGNMSSAMLHDRWFYYSPEEEKIIEQHISSTRRRQRWPCKVAKDMDGDQAQGYGSDDVAGGGDHAKGSDTDDVADYDHHAKGSKFVDLASLGHARLYKSIAGDDHHSKGSECGDVAADIHARLSEVDAGDDVRANGSEADNVLGDDNHTKGYKCCDV